MTYVLHSALSCAGPATTRLTTNEINRMLHEEVTEPVTAECHSPIELERRKDGSLRFFVDHWKQNAIAVRYKYLLQRLDECIDSVGEVTIFSTLYVKYRYPKIEVNNKNDKKTASKSHQRLLVCQNDICLKHAPATGYEHYLVFDKMEDGSRVLGQYHTFF